MRPATAIGQHGDAFFSVWRLAWVAHQLTTDPLHLFDGNIFYPEPRTLAYSDAMLLPAVVLAPFQWAGARPIVVYNLFLLSTFVLNAVAAYVLVYRLVGSYAAGVLAGVIFAFSPYRFEHFDHLEMQLSFWIPLAVLAWHRAVERQTTRDCLVVSALVAAQVLSCIYYAVFLITSLGAITALWFWRTPMKAIRAGTLMLLPAMVVFAIYSLPYLGNRDRLGDRPEGMIAGYSATLTDFVSAPRTNRLYGWTDRFGAAERHLFPGLVAVSLLVVGLWPPLDRRRAIHAAGTRARVPARTRIERVDLRLALRVGAAVSRPARAGARGHSHPPRHGGARRVWAWRGSRRDWGVGVVRPPSWRSSWAWRRLEYLVEAGAAGRRSARLAVVRHAARRMPDAVVFEWPVTVPWRIWNMVDVTYMYRSTLHWRPLLNGYSGFYPQSYIKLLIKMRSFPDTRSIAYLQRIGGDRAGDPRDSPKAPDRLRTGARAARARSEDRR